MMDTVISTVTVVATLVIGGFVIALLIGVFLSIKEKIVDWWEDIFPIRLK